MLRAAGMLGKVNVVAVGSGWPSAARGLLAELRVDAGACRLRMLSDPHRAAYTHLRAHRGVVRTFTWRRVANFLGFLTFPVQCCCKRRMPGLNAGDPWQQGGVFVFDRSQREIFALREQSPGWPALDAGALVEVVALAVAPSHAR